jgi:hypothetical protein
MRMVVLLMAWIFKRVSMAFGAKTVYTCTCAVGFK